MSEPIRSSDWISQLPKPNLVDSATIPVAAPRMDQERLSRFERLLPARHRQSSFLDPVLRKRVTPPSAIGIAKASSASKHVVIMGGTGAGKTTLAVAMLRAAWESNGRRSNWHLFTHAVKLGTARIQHSAGHGEAEDVERAMFAPHLVLDDLGQERETQNNAVPDVIFERHAEDRQTWITTGLTAEEIASRYGGGIARRVFEGAVIIRLGGGK